MTRNERQRDGGVSPVDELVIGYRAIGLFLRVGPRMVGKLVRTAGLPIAKVGANRVTTRAALLAWVRRRAEEAGGG